MGKRLLPSVVIDVTFFLELSGMIQDKTPLLICI